jgi:hypothetical protein
MGCHGVTDSLAREKKQRILCYEVTDIMYTGASVGEPGVDDEK